MASRIKKIFWAFDFRNNKILNAKVNTPTQNQHIANKEYVDSAGVNASYDTVKAQTYQTPFLFNLMGNIFEKTFKQIFDDLFFPRVLPTYLNPEVIITNILCTSHNDYYNQQVTLDFSFTLFSNDRNPAGLSQIVVNNGVTIQTFNDAFPGSGKITCNFLLLPGTTFTFKRQYGVANSTKQDSYGIDYTPVEFESTFELSQDIIVNKINGLDILNSPMISDLRLSEGIPTYDETNISSQFSYKTIFTIPDNTEGIYDFLIPEDIKIKLLNGYSMFFNDIEMVDSWCSLNSTITFNGIVYNKYQFNFGIFDNNKTFVLKFKK